MIGSLHERLQQFIPFKFPSRTRKPAPTTTSSIITGTATLAYLGIVIEHNQCHIATSEGTPQLLPLQSGKPAIKQLGDWMEAFADKHHCKIVAAGLGGAQATRQLAAQLWLQYDIVPVLAAEDRSIDPGNLRAEAQTRFDAEGRALIKYLDHREIGTEPLITLADHQRTATPQEFTLLQDQVKQFAGKKLVFVSATPRGGGVALMRHALIRLYKDLNVDAHWHVLQESAEAFAITKTKFHNVLQGVASPDVILVEEDQQIYLEWSARNAELLAPVLSQADVLVIDDPQPAGLIPHIRQLNPHLPIIYRSHIQILADQASTSGTPQAATWDFIWNHIRHTDCFVSHPMPQFVPASVDKQKVVYMPATTDPLDGLNKPLTRQQRAYYHRLFNAFLAAERQTPLDLSRPYLIQIARFDPSKGIPDVLESYALLRHQLEADHQPVPQLVIAGNGSIDDPDGEAILNLTLTLLEQERYAVFAQDVKVARLPHNDQLLNTLLTDCTIALQLSHKEGYEVKVTEALMKGRPIIAYRAGGIPLQIDNQKNGFVVDTGDTEEVAKRLHQLLTNQSLYARMSKAAATGFRKEALTIPNAIRWLYLANQLLQHRHINQHDRLFRQLFT